MMYMCICAFKQRARIKLKLKFKLTFDQQARRGRNGLGVMRGRPPRPRSLKDEIEEADRRKLDKYMARNMFGSINIVTKSLHAHRRLGNVRDRSSGARQPFQQEHYYQLLVETLRSEIRELKRSGEEEALRTTRRRSEVDPVQQFRPSSSVVSLEVEKIRAQVRRQEEEMGRMREEAKNEVIRVRKTVRNAKCKCIFLFERPLLKLRRSCLARSFSGRRRCGRRRRGTRRRWRSCGGSGSRCCSSSSRTADLASRSSRCERSNSLRSKNLHVLLCTFYTPLLYAHSPSFSYSAIGQMG